MIDGGRPCFWLQQRHSFKIRRIRRFVGQWWSRRLDRRRVYDSGRCDGQLTGVENDLFRPFVRRLDPDNRSIETDRLIGKYRCGRWQTRAADEQQSRKRASDEDKIAGYGHRLSLLKIEQFPLSIKTPKEPNPSLGTCSLGERAAMIGVGLTLVTNATKHNTPMANVAPPNMLLISAPVPFPFRVDAAPQRPTPLP
jgi:hypothetical protein